MSRRRARARTRARRPQRAVSWVEVALGLAAILGVAVLAWALAWPGRPANVVAVTDLTPVAQGEVVSASGVRVDAATVDFGRVPLDVTVQHAFRVSNDGPAPVTLGRAAIEVLDGC